MTSKVSYAVLGLILTFSISIVLSFNGIGDGPNVKHYDPILYDLNHVKSQHLRSKRAIANDNENKIIEVNMKSLERDFPIKLSVNSKLFHPGAVFENSDGRIHYDTEKAVTGSLHGQPNSTVIGVLSPSGSFDGVISTESGDEFYVEPAERYWNSEQIKSTGIIYKAQDVNWPSPPNQNFESPCASHQLHLQRKEETKSTITKPNIQNSTSRSKRWIVDTRKKTCMLYLQADYLFYSRVGSEEATIDIMTGHVQRLNQIYSVTDFDLDGEPDDIQFMIKRIKVYTKNGEADAKYPYEGHYEVIKFLERFSEGDYDSFCLAYMFTFRDFEGGTLGLAWTGDLKNAGGICEKQGHFRGGVKSLNTGIITLLNYGKVVSPAVSHVTLAHEVGHNFGSPHDPEGDKTCTPGGDDGNYIMFARATAGDRRNNNKFSPCSLKSIAPVLNFKARNIHGCFTAPQPSICGNGVVEEGEECDCGWEEDCRETCCFPMRRSYSRKETPCRLKPGSECSPSKGPCCTGNCTLKHGDKCRDDNGCRNVGFCDGSGAPCPPSILKPNKTICNKESVCFMGECTGSICLAYGLESCQCNQDSSERPMKLCEICCKLPGDNQPCISSFDLVEDPYDVPPLYAKPGTPCRNYTGYCDTYHFCREVDPSGPLATLRKLLAADEGLATIAEWIDNHWYVAVGAIVLLVILMILTAKLCGKTAKARLRKLTVMHSNIEAIQIQRAYVEDGDFTVHPTAVRKKIPFKKKVRERRSKHRNQNGQTKKRKATPVTDKNSGKGEGSSGSIWKRKKREPIKLEMTATAPAETKADSTQNSPNPEGPLLAVASSSSEITNMPSTSTSSATAIAGSSQSQNSASISHEPKMAIVPHAKDAKRKHRQGSRSHKSKPSKTKDNASSGNKAAKKKSKTKLNIAVSEAPAAIENKQKNETKSSDTKKSKISKTDPAKDNAQASTSSPKNVNASASAPTGSKPKPNLQAIYKPPFSIKLEFTRKSNPNNLHESSISKSVTKDSKADKPSKSKSQATKSHKSQAKVPKDSFSGTVAAAGASSSSPSKYKAVTASLLRRRKGHSKHNPKSPGKSGELQILIPNNLEDDETLTPTTPATS